jgi:hypothetical protein
MTMGSHRRRSSKFPVAAWCAIVALVSWSWSFTTHASECSDLRDAIPRYRKCIIDAESAIAKLADGRGRAIVIPGGGSGPSMRESYEGMRDTCRQLEARARSLLQTCSESSGEAASGATQGSSHNGRADSSPNAALTRQRQLIQALANQRFRFDGKDSAKKIAQLAERLRELQQGLREMDAGAMGRDDTTTIDLDLPEGSLYDLKPKNETPPRRAPKGLDGSRLCTEIEFRPDGTSQGWPDGCINPGVLPDASFPGPRSEAERSANVRELSESYVDTHHENLTETNARDEVAGIPVDHQAPPESPVALWNRERFDLAPQMTAAPQPVLHGGTDDAAVRSTDSAPQPSILDDADVLDTVASALPMTNEGIYRFSAITANCIVTVVTSSATELRNGAAGPVPAEPCDDDRSTVRRTLERVLLPDWTRDPRVRSFACKVFTCEETVP